MANIHGFDHDYLNSRSYQSLNEQNTDYNDRMFIGYRDWINYGFKEHPSKENFLDMLKTSYCPRIKLYSFTFVICMILTFIYIIMISVEGINRSSSLFLSIYEQTLRNYGGNTPVDVRSSFQIFRWLTSTLLITDFYSLIASLFVIMIGYSALEAVYGYKFAIILYFGAGSCGALFGDVCNICQPYAMTFSEVYSCLYGISGFQIGSIIKNWKQIGLTGRRWNCIFFAAVVFITIVFATIFPPIDDEEEIRIWYFDLLGFVGGLLAGIFITLIFIDVPQSTQYENRCKLIGCILLGLQIGLCFILLFSLNC